ncbi:1807_t:CDS:2 [Dentiscutata heterogama]|uniref:1807_t:CDS:1 n=1 Tax=Dentiscutata heterogama TaxID=1316150 RepID=A0ACA9K5W1_9GLOM|nr:1807_t:CDS:2 [Dentiscutata heterogama]
MSSIFSKSISQNESNDDSQNPESRIDSSEYSTSDESISEFDKKRKKAKVKKSVGRPEDPVNKEYIKLGVRDKHGHVAMKCLVSEAFQIIYQKALTIWKSLDGGDNSVRELIAQIHNYDFRLPPYNSFFQDHLELPEIWWSACKVPQHHLQKLALLLLAITPHNAGCERVFSVLNWFTQKCRNRLTIKKVSNMAKLHAYYVTNARHELNYVGQDLSESDFLNMMHNYTNSLTSGAAMFEEDIQLYDSEDDFDIEDNLEDNLEDNSITNDLSEVDSSMLEIENSINLNLALNNMNQPLILDEVIDHGEKDFDIDSLVNQGMQMRNASNR